MLLSEIKRIISERGEVCVTELYSTLDADKELINHALYQLASKGVIIEVVPEKHCRGCMMNCQVRGEKVYRTA